MLTQFSLVYETPHEAEKGVVPMFLRYTRAVTTKSKREKREFVLSIPSIYQILKMLFGKPYKLIRDVGLYG